MTNLADRLDSFPESWRPKNAGEKLIGEVTDVDLRDSEYGDPYPILTVLVESGQEDGEPLEPGTEKGWHAFHAMARNEVAKKKPQIGERVGIVYAGLGEAQPGMNPPVRWRLLVDRPKQQVEYPPTDEEKEGGEEPPPAGDASASSADDDIPF
jgi:hypothetical protein